MNRKWIKCLMLLLITLTVTMQAHAIELKQGALIRWDDDECDIENLTTVTIARTYPIESLGKWNVLWDGWTLDFGAAYAADQFNTGALLIGRNFGTIGKYLPVEFPLKDRLEVSIYPVGIIASDILGDAEISGASGLGIAKFEVNF